ncbi:MAG: segregation/condensation protein A [Sedimentisphaerales bacterium]|nr:segregation/condensation protein A [Sedimentisphaerales bacterium]
MSDYRVNLDIFAGPLDLLLYLVRKEEVDIYDIPISKITDQYLQYIELIKSFDMDLAGDFLVMAATLMQIKSAMLLPRAETESDGEEDLSDPRKELIRQLLEYKKFKDAANMLNAVADEQIERFGRPDTVIQQFKHEKEPELDLEQVTIWDLLEAFDTVCKAIGNPPDISSIIDDTPIDLYQIEVLHRLQTEGPLIFQRIFESCMKTTEGDSRNKRLVLVGHFLAVLELIREKLISVEQPTPATIYLRSMTDEPAEHAVRNAIFSTEEERDSRMETRDAEYSGQPAPIVAIESPSQEQETSDEISELDMEDEEDLEFMHELSGIGEQEETNEIDDEQETLSSDESQLTSDDTVQKPPIAITELPPQKTTSDVEVESKKEDTDSL